MAIALQSPLALGCSRTPELSSSCPHRLPLSHGVIHAQPSHTEVVANGVAVAVMGVWDDVLLLLVPLRDDEELVCVKEVDALG